MGHLKTQISEKAPWVISPRVKTNCPQYVFHCLVFFLLEGISLHWNILNSDIMEYDNRVGMTSSLLSLVYYWRKPHALQQTHGSKANIRSLECLSCFLGFHWILNPGHVFYGKDWYKLKCWFFQWDVCSETNKLFKIYWINLPTKVLCDFSQIFCASVW